MTLLALLRDVVMSEVQLAVESPAPRAVPYLGGLHHDYRRPA